MVVNQRRSKFRPKFLFLALLALLLIGCADSLTGTNNNWPGLSTAENVVYMAYGNNIVAVDATDERELWRYPEGNSAAPLLAPPTADGDRVYVADYGASQGFLSPGVIAGVSALDATNINGGIATRVWHNERVATDRIVAAPLAVDGYVFVGTSDNRVVALDESDGAELWSQELGHGVWGQPAYVDGLLIVGSLDKAVHAFDAATGDIRWTKPVGGAIASSPLVIEDRIYITGFDAQLHAFDLDGNDLWQVDATDWIWNAPAYDDGRLFFGDVKGHVYAVDATDGTILWETTVSGSVEAGVAAADGVVFISSVIGVATDDEQTGELLAVSAETGDQLWRKELSTPIFTSPVIAGDRLVVLFSNSADNPVELRFYDLATGSESGLFVPADS